MVTTPVMLSDLIKRLAPGRVELDVVAELTKRRALALRLQQLRPELVVIGLHRTESEAMITKLLPLLPKAKFIVFSYDARIVTGYELRLIKTELSNLSPDALIAFISQYDEKIGS